MCLCEHMYACVYVHACVRVCVHAHTACVRVFVCLRVCVCVVADYRTLLATIEKNGMGTTNQGLVRDPQYAKKLAKNLEVSPAEAVLWQWRREQEKKGLKEDEELYEQLSRLLENHLSTIFAGEFNFYTTRVTRINMELSRSHISQLHCFCQDAQL